MMCHCTCIFPNTLISGIIISLQSQLRLLPYSPMLIQMQILEVSLLHLWNPPGGQFPMQCIHDCNPAYDSLHYVLLFPLGDLGWHDQLPAHHARGEGRLTQNEYYSYWLHEHTAEPPTLLHGGDSSSNLLWMHGHTLRSVGYHGSDISKESFMLPNSMGLWMLPMLGIILVMLASPSFYLQAALEVHRACSNFARTHMLKPDLFITATANPQWEDSQVAVLPGQIRSDHPDIVTCVVHLKMEALLDEINKKGVFGGTVAHIYTIEFQKHGLHIHLLIFLHAATKPITPAQILLSVLSSLIQLLSHVSIPLTPKS